MTKNTRFPTLIVVALCAALLVAEHFAAEVAVGAWKWLYIAVTTATLSVLSASLAMLLFDVSVAAAVCTFFATAATVATKTICNAVMHRTSDSLENLMTFALVCLWASAMCFCLATMKAIKSGAPERQNKVLNGLGTALFVHSVLTGTALLLLFADVAWLNRIIAPIAIALCLLPLAAPPLFSNYLQLTDTGSPKSCFDGKVISVVPSAIVFSLLFVLISLHKTLRYFHYNVGLAALIAAISAVVIVALYLIFARRIRKTVTSVLTIIISVAALCTATVVTVNDAYSAPQETTTCAIAEKNTYRGGIEQLFSTSYYITVEKDGERYEASVAEEFYHNCDVGDDVYVLYHKGALGIDYLSIEGAASD